MLMGCNINTTACCWNHNKQEEEINQIFGGLSLSRIVGAYWTLGGGQAISPSITPARTAHHPTPRDATAQGVRALPTFFFRAPAPARAPLSCGMGEKNRDRKGRGGGAGPSSNSYITARTGPDLRHPLGHRSLLSRALPLVPAGDHGCC
jgi:hypothetical protein